MKRDKKGKPIFDSLEEAHRYVDTEYTEDKIRQRALKRENPVNIECSETRCKSLLATIDAYLSSPKHAELRRILSYIIDAKMKTNASHDDIIAYLSHLTRKTIQEVKDLERKALDIIKEKLYLITPGTFSDIK